jgi:hypothetical protein
MADVGTDLVKRFIFEFNDNFITDRRDIHGA